MKFDYGESGLEIALDPSWNVTIIRPEKQNVIEDPINAVRKAIRNPLGLPPLKQIIHQKNRLDKICIVVSDATRPVPSHIILEGVIRELKEYGIEDKQIFILIATGLHRPSRNDERERILGKELKNRLEVIDHMAKDIDSLKYIGNSSTGVPIYINKNYYNSDFKILTGYVEPHLFAGFSGGRKAIVPGIVGQETILGNHSAEMIDSSHARFGIFEKNPLHKNMLEIAKKVGVDFTLNVCINEEHKITKIAAGELEQVHECLVDYQLEHAFKEISEPFDIVVCGNGGYPLDLDLYQAVKSMLIGEMVVKKEGTIIAVNECIDGIGQDTFKDLLNLGITPSEIYEKVMSKEIAVLDQWEIQVLARVLMKADIYVVSKLKENELGNIGLKYASSVENAIKLALKKHGKNAKILMLPNGPQILPLLKKKKGANNI
jgi:nickel-dependent lactate racemase